MTTTAHQRFMGQVEFKRRLRAHQRDAMLAEIQEQHGITFDSSMSLEQLQRWHYKRHRLGARHLGEHS